SGSARTTIPGELLFSPFLTQAFVSLYPDRWERAGSRGSFQGVTLGADRQHSLLNLHDRTELGRRASRNDQVSPGGRRAAVYALAYGADGVDDGGAGRIRREAGQRLERARALRVG